MKRQNFILDIDVTSTCNLQCPSCPQGNSKYHRQSPGLMAPDLLGRIVKKASAECIVKGINLFNWGEPLLHPEIHRLIRIVQDAGIPCHLSSNLNILPDADALMAANPASFKISVSGFTQEIYGITHRGGCIVRVKNNMAELAAAKKRNNADTRIFVNYHRYRHNLIEEPMMRKLAVDLGFDFEPAWALLLPLEKILAFLDQTDDGTPLTDEDSQLIDRLALPLNAALDLSREHRDLFCRLREEQVSIDFQGNVQLCCGIFDSRRFSLLHFLDISLDKIQELRHGHSLCQHCMNNGAHVYLTYGAPGIEALIMETIRPEDARMLNLRYEFSRNRLKLRLQKLYRTLFSRVLI